MPILTDVAQHLGPALGWTPSTWVPPEAVVARLRADDTGLSAG